MAIQRFNQLYLFFLYLFVSCSGPERVLDITNGSPRDVTFSTAVVEGIVIDLGEGATMYGHCFGKNSGVTVNNSTVKNGSLPVATGPFSTDLNSLEQGSTYYYNAFISDGKHTEYGEEKSFITPVQTTIKDYDQNVYSIITIGSQTWTKENLRSTHFRDGSSISLVTDDNSWENHSTPAYSWYNNDYATNGALYGAFYNWYAVQTGKLCPSGWHVPTDSEWALMESYLIDNGYNYDGSTSGNKIAKSLASANYWESAVEPGTPGNTDYPEYRNKSNFTALPGGYRAWDGSWHSQGIFAGWWSATEIDFSIAVVPSVGRDTVSIFRLEAAKIYGHQIRCIKD